MCVSVLGLGGHQSRLSHHKQAGPLMIFSIHNLGLCSCYLVAAFRSQRPSHRQSTVTGVSNTSGSNFFQVIDD